MIQPNVNWITSASVPYGNVISINPVSGTTVAQWTYVEIFVSLGPSAPTSNTSVPSLIGLRQYSAHQAINAASLIWNVDLYAYGTVTGSWSADTTLVTADSTLATADGSYTVAQGLVISQTPVAGTSVAPGTVVQITVSLGAATTPVYVTVP